MSKIRTLKAGTVLHGKGNALPISLAKDAEVTFPTDSDESFVGWLISYKPNFDLNIGSVEGKWSPVTGRREAPEPVMSALKAQADVVKPVSPLVQAIRYAMQNNWSDALACYETAKLSLALTDEELIAKGNSAREKEILRNLANDVDDQGHRVLILNAKVDNLPPSLTGAH